MHHRVDDQGLVPAAPVKVAVALGLVRQLLHCPKELTLDSVRLPDAPDRCPPQRARLLGVLHPFRMGTGILIDPGAGYTRDDLAMASPTVQ